MDVFIVFTHYYIYLCIYCIYVFMYYYIHVCIYCIYLKFKNYTREINKSTNIF